MDREQIGKEREVGRDRALGVITCHSEYLETLGSVGKCKRKGGEKGVTLFY